MAFNQGKQKDLLNCLICVDLVGSALHPDVAATALSFGEGLICAHVNHFLEPILNLKQSYFNIFFTSSCRCSHRIVDFHRTDPVTHTFNGNGLIWRTKDITHITEEYLPLKTINVIGLGQRRSQMQPLCHLVQKRSRYKMFP